MKTILVDAINGLVNEDATIDQEMLAILEAYPNNKIVLTGANDEQFAHFKLGDAPYEVFTLKHEPEKSNPEYYSRMLEQYGLEADDVVYFEHNQEAADSAKSVGINTYFYDSSVRDLAALKQFIDQSL